MGKFDKAGCFFYQQPESASKKSVLYNEHLKLTNKSRMADFAGYVMPLWYSSIREEHGAVRSAAGMFDCSHMGILEFSGAAAEGFLNLIATNDVSRLVCGKAQYSYILDAAGNILDDIIIYKRGEEVFMVVVNASNEPKIKAYLIALKDGSAVVDADDAGGKIESWPVIRDMRDAGSDGESRVDIALQGPASLEVISGMLEDEVEREKLEKLGKFCFFEANVGGIDCIVARTGYTGAKVGFELYVNPGRASELWGRILGNGEKSGLRACGLGARDSLRIEAGLPLYGHELDGEYGISPFEAGYGWAVKLDKGFFIGKKAMVERNESFDMEVCRLELAGEKGVRPVRSGDAVISKDGECIGWVLSASKAGERQVALCYINRNSVTEDDIGGVYYLARNKRQVESGKREAVNKGEKIEVELSGKIVNRFENF
ncbi:MAG: glycine cleavage system aminomethyltransferase GcvT [Planctomycetes bacterium]|nr:glycine cleavage system aminomethyltransferase GcvT [Planctomycetota bacterium]MBL7106722.1 glycine cleavage system aminomethyltransferase GcvT [Phycisphaerae bacterium]